MTIILTRTFQERVKKDYLPTKLSLTIRQFYFLCIYINQQPAVNSSDSPSW